MKRVLGIILVLLAVGSLAFAQAQAETVDDGKVKLSMFHYLDLTDPVATANWDILLSTFEATYPEIELEIEYGFNEPYHDKLQAMAIANQLPDIMFLWPGKRTGMVTSAGKAKDLSPWLEGKLDGFSPTAVAAQGPNGEIFELPEQVTATHVMYTNEKLMAELGLTLPKTLDEMVAQGDVIRAAGYTPIAMTNGDGWQMQSCFLSALIDRTGGRKWMDSALAGDVSFADDEFINALNVIDVLAKNDMFSAGINTLNYGSALTEFVTGKAVYYIDGGWRVNNLNGELPADMVDYVTLNVFPSVPMENGQAASTAAVAGTGHGMNANLSDAEADAAFKWIWFYSGPVGSAIRQSFGALPAYKIPMPNDIDPLTVKLSEFVNNTPSGYVIDAVMDGEGMGVLHPALQELIFGTKTPEEVGAEYEAWVAANER